MKWTSWRRRCCGASVGVRGRGRRYPARPHLEALETRWVPSFLAARGFDVGDGPNAEVAADFNGDGIPDIAVAGGGVSVLLGNDDGSFQTGPAFAA